jgi:hypothetical protein
MPTPDSDNGRPSPVLAAQLLHGNPTVGLPQKPNDLHLRKPTLRVCPPPGRRSETLNPAAMRYSGTPYRAGLRIDAGKLSRYRRGLIVAVSQQSFHDAFLDTGNPEGLPRV